MEFERATYFFVVVALTLIGLIWGIADTRRVIEAPFLYATGMALILCPQYYIVAVGAVEIPDEAFRVLSIMVFLCSGALYLGYFREPRKPINKNKSSVETWSIVHAKLYRLGLVAALVGAFGFYKLKTMGTITEWRGWPVYWFSLTVFIMPGITLMVVAYLHNRTLPRLVSIILLSLIPLSAVTESGRRSAALTLPLMYLVPLVLYRKNFRIPRSTIIISLVLAFIVVYAFPIWRDSFKEHEYAQTIEDHPLTEILRDMFQGNRGKPLEITDGMIVMGARYRRGNYEWGSGFYNQVIQNYFPGGLIGRDFKESLRFGEGISHDWVTEVYGIPVATYTAKSGYEDLFAQFWFAGCIVVYWVARGFRSASDAAEYARDPRAAIFLCFFISFPATIPYGPTIMLVTLSFPVLLLMFLAFRLCLVKRQAQGIIQVARLMPVSTRPSRIPARIGG